MGRLVLPRYADRSAFLQMALDRVINSVMLQRRDRDTYNRRLGYLFTSNSELTTVRKEYTYTARTNSRGFRTREFQPRSPGEYRVVILGDSMFFGVGVEEQDLLSTHLERFANRPTARLVQVYNLAVPGYSTVQELILAREMATTLQPDHLIVGLFVSNDLIPNWLTFVDQDGNYAIDAGRVDALKSELDGWLFGNVPSVIWRVVAVQGWAPRIRYQIARRPEVMDATQRLLLAMKEVARCAGSHLTVVIIYPRNAVLGSVIQHWLGSSDVGRRLVEFCSAQRIEIIDLLDVMEAAHDRNTFFYPEDGHLTPEGHRVVAEAVYERSLKPRLASDHMEEERSAGRESKSRTSATPRAR